jgi:5'(3')-deoxyribonucleotidase
MSRTDTILLDIDGCIVDFASTYLYLLRARHGVSRDITDITTFDFTGCVATKEQDADIWGHINSTPRLVYQLPMYDGARQFLSELRQLGRVVACTSPASGRWAMERWNWLQNEAGFAKSDIVITSAKELVIGDFLVDDSNANCAKWQDGAGMGGFALLFDRPWNRSAMSWDYWQRVNGYNDCLETIRELQSA